MVYEETIMTIKEYCKNVKNCKGCLLEGLCKGTDRDKFRPENYTYSEDMWVTHRFLILADILKR